MRLLEASGSAREIGYAIGSAAPELVRGAVELVCRFDVQGAELEARLDRIERRLLETFPHAVEEAAGLAEGAGIGVREALSLSVCSDLSGRLPSYCSLGAFAGSDGLLVGKNLDSTEEMAPLQVLERLAPDGALAFLNVTTAGAMWTDGGVNEAGLALVNASVAAGTPSDDGVPDGILARELLMRCADVPAALEFASRYDVMTLGENMLVADARGRAAVIEKLPGGQAVRERAPVAACNHVVTRALEERHYPGDPIRDDSLRRLELLSDAIDGNGPWTRQSIESLLGDPNRGLAASGAAGTWTIARYVISPRLRRLWLHQRSNDERSVDVLPPT